MLFYKAMGRLYLEFWTPKFKEDEITLEKMQEKKKKRKEKKGYWGG